MIVLENVSKVFRIPHERTKTLYHKLLSYTKAAYTYEDLYAIKNVNIHIKEGEFIGIIGRNGSGKSTLLRLIAGVYRPTAGKIVVNEEISPLLELGLGFDNNFSCRDNIYVYGALLGFSRAQMAKRIDEILFFSELEKFADAKLDMLSSGMRSRLAFAIAIQSIAPIVLVDEILAVGDKVFAEKCRNIFKMLKQQGRTIVLVSHDTGSIKEYCDRVAVIHQGEIIGDGKPEQMIDFYNKVVLTAKDTTISSDIKKLISSSVTKKSTIDNIPQKEKIQENIKEITLKSSIKVNDNYNAKEFWNRRLKQNFNLRGVGNITFSERYNQYLYKQRLNVLKNVIRKYTITIEGKKVLDVGCGTGYFSKYYLDNSAKVTGVDIAPVVIQKLQGIFTEGDFLPLDITRHNDSLPYNFDIIHIFSTTFHITNDDEFKFAMISLCDRLKVGGYIFITDLFTSDISPAPHVKFRSMEKYKIMENKGIKILKILPIHHIMNKRLKYLSNVINDVLAPFLLYFDSMCNYLHLNVGDDLKLLVGRREK